MRLDEFDGSANKNISVVDYKKILNYIAKKQEGPSKHTLSNKVEQMWKKGARLATSYGKLLRQEKNSLDAILKQGTDLY